MGDDYNAYSVNYMQVSTNGTDFTTVGTYNLPNRGWESKEFALPASCEEQAKIWVRFMPDYASPLTGVASVNDGTAVAEIFVLADSNQADDHEAPLLVTSIPAQNEECVSATGSVILTFNEKVVLGFIWTRTPSISCARAVATSLLLIILRRLPGDMCS